MPQFTAPISINDGTATPVAVSYAPEQLSSGATVLVDRREASRDMQPSLTLKFDPANANRKTFKVARQVAYPIKRTINTVDQVVDIARANVEYIIPKTMSAQERKHLRALVANAEDIASFKAGVEDLDPLY
jgi:hypothetical protein